MERRGKGREEEWREEREGMGGREGKEWEGKEERGGVGKEERGGISNSEKRGLNLQVNGFLGSFLSRWC